MTSTHSSTVSQRVPQWDREVEDGQGRIVRKEDVLDVTTSAPQTMPPLHLDITATSACPANRVALRRRAMASGQRMQPRINADDTT